VTAATPGADPPAGIAPSGVTPSGARGLGALHDTRTLVAGVAGGAGRSAERARDLAQRLGSDGDRLLLALGGGPPVEVREAGTRNREAVAALEAAAVALSDAAIALRSFSRRAG